MGTYNFETSVQFSSVTQSCLTLCDPMNHCTPGLPVHHQLPEFTQTCVHRVGDANQPSHPLLPLLLLPPIPSSIRVFSKESTLCMRWPKYWTFSFSIIPSKEIPGVIGTEMRDIGPVLKERKKIVKSVGRAEKKARGLGGGLERKSLYKVIVRKEASARKARSQNKKKKI